MAAHAQAAGVSLGGPAFYALAQPEPAELAAGAGPSVASVALSVQQTPQAVPKFHGPLWRVADVEGGYAAIRSTTPPTKCGCFSADGGNGSMVYHLTEYLGIAGDGSRVWAPSASNDSGFNLTTYLFGPQVSTLVAEHLLAFGHFLLGKAQADGAQRGRGTASAGAFADAWGGGLDWVLSRDTSVRIAEIDEDVTHFQAGIAGRQRNLRLVFGVVFRFKTR